LAEVWAVRYALLISFMQASQAASKAKQLSPDSVLKFATRQTREKLSKRGKLFEDSSL